MKVTGPWSQQDIDNYLAAIDVPMRIAVVSEDGYPRVVSLWFLYRDNRLLCLSHRDAPLIRLLRGNPRVGFEIAPNHPPYRGVRGQGDATLIEDSAHEVLDVLLQRYLGNEESRVGNWLKSRVEEEILVEIAPRRLYSWDYSDRMADVSAATR